MRVREGEREVVPNGVVRWYVSLFQAKCGENAEQEVSKESGENQDADIDLRRSARCAQCYGGVPYAHVSDGPAKKGCSNRKARAD